ncbi:uncharacterized protein CLUP02_02735 [Colletotrichum lupini]|uniref:Uncharacterized protein n=1 Tax=Colletotrichum lupini TaxID=145971 RepID=A0A9Q8SHK4_9PEZI|nr:uncharacterized protein CLUP02_02735 [Colletotrichum lupini]UQC77268.1 hypothetical protein CLUP02_02735 [Colletotrichum lupini]
MLARTDYTHKNPIFPLFPRGERLAKTLSLSKAQLSAFATSCSLSEPATSPFPTPSTWFIAPNMTRSKRGATTNRGGVQVPPFPYVLARLRHTKVTNISRLMSLRQSWGPSAKSLDVTKTMYRLATESTSQDPKTVGGKGAQYDNSKGRAAERHFPRGRRQGQSVQAATNHRPRGRAAGTDPSTSPWSPFFRSRGAFKALPSSVTDWQMSKMK